VRSKTPEKWQTHVIAMRRTPVAGPSRTTLAPRAEPTLHHDINNLLAGLLMNLDLCLPETHGETRETLEDARLAARRLQELMGRLPDRPRLTPQR
jgi:hypothetical protein